MRRESLSLLTIINYCKSLLGKILSELSSSGIDLSKLTIAGDSCSSLLHTTQSLLLSAHAHYSILNYLIIVTFALIFDQIMAFKVFSL